MLLYACTCTCKRAQSSWMSQSRCPSDCSMMGLGGRWVGSVLGLIGCLCMPSPAFSFCIFISRLIFTRAELGRSNSDRGTRGASSFLCFCLRAVGKASICLTKCLVCLSKCSVHSIQIKKSTVQKFTDTKVAAVFLTQKQHKILQNIMHIMHTQNHLPSNYALKCPKYII